MDGTRSPSPTDRIMKVRRSFEWSRLESELMTSAYERVLPVGRFVRSESSLNDYDHACCTIDRTDDGRQRYATGA